MATIPRGLRNNNPGNIRNSSDNFVGEMQPSTDSSFKQFVDMAHGYRAMFVMLNTYINKGYNTIAKIINRWAPSSDGNNTESYITNVSNRTGINRNQILTPDNGEEIIKIVAAMSKSENGIDAVMSDVQKGFNLQNGIKKKVTQ
jgi:hypothetical protein